MEGYVKKTVDCLQVLVRQDVAAACAGDDLDAFCRCLFDEPPAERFMKKGAYKTLYRFELGGRPCIVKSYKHKGLAGMLKSVVVASRARREFGAAACIEGRGIATAAPLLLAEEKVLGMVRRSAVVLDFIDGARELSDFFFCSPGAVPAAERWRVAEAFGRLTARIFMAGVYQYDLALQNFLIRRTQDAAPVLYFIDFERVRIKSGISRAHKTDMLARLGRVGAEVSLKDRLRFLRGYLSVEPGMAPTLKGFAAELIDATVGAIRSDRRRGRITSIYTHARYDRLREAGRSGLCRRGTDVPVLLNAVAALSGREPAGQLVIRHAGRSLSLRAVYLEPGQAEDAWAALTALKIAGVPIDLPHGLVCSEITGCLLFSPSPPAACTRFLSSSTRSRVFVERHFSAELELLKSLLAKL